MTDFAIGLIKTEIRKRKEMIINCSWWIRTIEALVVDEEQLKNKNKKKYIEAYNQRLRSFQETRNRNEKELRSLRAALRKIKV